MFIPTVKISSSNFELFSVSMYRFVESSCVSPDRSWQLSIPIFNSHIKIFSYMFWSEMHWQICFLINLHLASEIPSKVACSFVIARNLFLLQHGESTVSLWYPSPIKTDGETRSELRNFLLEVNICRQVYSTTPSSLNDTYLGMLNKIFPLNLHQWFHH